MTLVVGFVGADAAVMASDSQYTESDGTRYEGGEKIWLAPRNILLGYSGNTAIADPLRLAIEAALNGLEGSTVVNRQTAEDVLRVTALNSLTTLYIRYTPRFVSDQGFSLNPDVKVPDKIRGHLLAMGHDDEEGYWILDIDEHSQVTWHADRGFHAIGSGSFSAGVARAILASYEPQDRPLSQLRLMAYRTVATCIDVDARHLSHPVRLWSSENGCEFEEASADECKTLEGKIEDWIAIERESLPQAIGEGPAEETEEPMPEALE